jgi:flagellar basal-body rod protein FlgF
MLQGYYSAATAMRTALQNQDILAENLAHAPVPGYRRQALSFEAYVAPSEPSSSAAPAQALHGTKLAQSYTTFTPGDYQHTGNPLELAIQGDGFFVLNGPNGPLYTRNGQFQLDINGQLVSHNGYAVNGSGGPLRIPQNSATITVGQDGSVQAGTTQVGQVRVVSFADPRQLVRAGTTLFEAPAGVRPQASTASIRQGYRESANVQVVQEMVQMISGMRQYEAAAKALRSLSDAMQQRINGQM